MAHINMQPCPHRRRRAGGFMFLDAMVSLLTIVTLTVLLAVALGQQTRATRQLADTREAIRIAEATLQRLRDNRPSIGGTNVLSLAEAPGLQISLTPLHATTRGSIEWVQISVVCRTGRATLVGPISQNQGVTLR